MQCKTDENVGCLLEILHTGGNNMILVGLREGRYEIARALIRMHAEFEIIDDARDDALVYACARRLTDITQLLLDSGVNIYANVILMSGIQYGHTGSMLEVFRMLIRADAQLDQMDARGMTPLMICMRLRFCRRPMLMLELVRFGADIHKLQTCVPLIPLPPGERIAAISVGHMTQLKAMHKERTDAVHQWIDEVLDQEHNMPKVLSRLVCQLAGECIQCLFP